MNDGSQDGHEIIRDDDFRIPRRLGQANSEKNQAIKGID